MSYKAEVVVRQQDEPGMVSPMTHEEKALEIIRLIFHGGLSRDKQVAVKQVAAIIQRGVEPAGHQNDSRTSGGRVCKSTIQT